jgi:DNA replication protein DnaC
MITGRWIEEAQNLIIEGPAGVGKSWLACALGHKACRDNRSVLYQRRRGCSAILHSLAAMAATLD